jgi:hypothetical protein
MMIKQAFKTSAKPFFSNNAVSVARIHDKGTSEIRYNPQRKSLRVWHRLVRHACKEGIIPGPDAHITFKDPPTVKTAGSDFLNRPAQIFTAG